MRRGRSTGNPTRAQQARFDAIWEIGCIVARSLGLGFVPCEIHHLTIGGKHGAPRRGHDFSVGLNPWSHRGEPFGGMSADTCERLFGASYARQPRRFRQEVGSDDYLLDLQNTLIEDHTRKVALNQQQYDQAFEAGRRARQAGKPRDGGPLYAMGADGYELRQRWQEGWDAEDQDRGQVA